MDAQEQRRLLELAAKAANVDFYTPEGMDTPWCGSGFYLRGCAVWNPAEDDGDALRLAVTLRLTVTLTECECCAGIYACQLDGEVDGPDISVRHSSEFDDAETTDSYAAVRLAIVRAAAAIAENMEEEK